MQLVWFLLLFILTLSSGSKSEEIKSKEDEKPDPIPNHIILYLKVVSRDKFEHVKDLFKTLIAQIATKYCQQIVMLEINELGKENVFFEDLDTCPDSWFDFQNCVTGRLEIHLKVYPYRLNAINLKEIWRRTKDSPKLKELEIQEYKVSTTSRVLIIMLIVIIVILCLALVVLLYVFREKIMSMLGCAKENSEPNKATDDDSWTYRNNDIYDSAYIQPPGYTSYNNGQPYLEPVQRTNQNNQYITVLDEMAGKDNKGYQPDSGFNSVQRHPITAQTNEDDDEFDSGEEFSYPSPLKAPPIPPRNESSGDSKGSISTSSQSSNLTANTSLHYLSTPITH